MTDRHLRITFVGWQDEPVFAKYLEALDDLVKTARHLSTKPKLVTTTLCLANSAAELATPSPRTPTC